jgi:hypothetical protein
MEAVKFHRVHPGVKNLLTVVPYLQFNPARIVIVVAQVLAVEDLEPVTIQRPISPLSKVMGVPQAHLQSV